jgi:hypothetical protein
MPTQRQNDAPPGRGGGHRPAPKGRGPFGQGLAQGRRLVLLGVAGESVGVLAGAAGWRISGEPVWLVMSGISLALALVLLRRV